MLIRKSTLGEEKDGVVLLDAHLEKTSGNKIDGKPKIGEGGDGR